MTNDVVTKVDAGSALKWLRAKIRPRSGRTLVGIDGVDGAGKTTFADELADLLRESGLTVIRISMDHYLNPQSKRYAQGRSSAKGYFEDSYDYARFSDEVLEPLGHGGSGRYRTAAYDLDSESEVNSPWKIAPDDAVVIIDGMFMHRDELCSSRKNKVWDLSVWLEVPFSESFHRLAEREDKITPDPEDPANARYYQGQLIYLRSCDPAHRADLVVENVAPHSPVID
ncbi:MAG: uridine kinase [Actinobacteria bacterium]|uniref:uridine kinase n=1 Tax=Propionicimonas sp. T2.31MG-18 TaxID=3157620 RepID=UPI0035ECE623|nr:uridine kinase [Actinomycetota bacterium]